MWPPHAKLFLGLFMTLFATCTQAETLPLDQLKLPSGFKISIYAEDIPNARAMVLGERGTLFVGSREAGKVYAVIDDPVNKNKKKVLVIAKNLNMPAGVAFKDGALYVSEVNRILRFDNIEKNLNHPPKAAIVNNTFPSETHHGWKFIAFGPDGWLYVPVGAPCNICLSDDPRFASIMRMKPDGKDLEIFASGIRNTVGFDWDPKTKELWFTDNGRDMLGDDIPADELNHAPKKGMHFGYPFCHASKIADPEFGKQKICDEFTASAVDLGPHVAALGMRFYTGKMFPASYQNKIFIAEHGSWNRSIPLGYRVTVVDPKSHAKDKYQVFAQGWLQEGKAWGRPADVLVMKDGSLLVSDDKANVIYRIFFKDD
ncbi:MAG: sorbosone dehydrogenase family protein [Gammaproteobacteria bacterium]|jgi:glucose/arabinose dehydrogenase|nr:sorbosone dehydrogenase family protein [Gammaproteobacteria bacterium]